MTGPNLHLNSTVGCLFIGVIFAVMLYGCGCAQTIYYVLHYPKDPLYLKGLQVALLCALDTTRTILDVQIAWLYLVQNHANVSQLLYLPKYVHFPPVRKAPMLTLTWIRKYIYCKCFLETSPRLVLIPPQAEFIIAAFTVLVVQIYFIRTIWGLLGQLGQTRLKIIFTSAAMFLAMLSFWTGVGAIYRANLNLFLSTLLHNVTVPASIQTVTAFVTDAYITLSLCLILHGKRTGYTRTEAMISTLIIFAVNRGIFTGLAQLLHFSTYISTFKHDSSLVWMIFHFPGSKIYVNSLFAVLNVRHYIAEEGRYSSDTDEIDYQTLSMRFHLRSQQSQKVPTRGRHIPSNSQVRVMVMTETVQEEAEDGVKEP
ncbi:hypothetical protein AcV5_005010 [Taiwanofungus camphoratus]|nr:hypothetical protein AcV5_005010 [Antrodia cinnamomea]